MSPLVRSLLRSAGLSLLVFVPGVLLNSVSPWIGTIWLLISSFALVALRYRREWRLNPWTILLPPATTGLSFLVQTLVMRLTLVPVYLGIAVVGGGLLGLWRGRAHNVYRKDDGIYAQRTVWYLLIWLLAYTITQLLALARREGLTLAANVAGGFSTAMLVGVALVLLWRYFRQNRAPGQPVAIPGGTGFLIALALLTFGLSLASVARAQDDESILDEPFAEPQYLIAWDGYNAGGEFQEINGYGFFHVPPDQDGVFLTPDGAGGVFVNFGSIAGGPFSTRREACAAAAGVGEDVLFFLVNNTTFDCSPATAAPIHEDTAAGETHLGEEAVFVTSLVSAITMVVTSAAGNALTTVATTMGSSGGPSTSPTMIDDTKVISGREAIEELVSKGAVRVGNCITEASLEKIMPNIGAIAYRTNERGLVCPDDVSMIRPWRHPDTDPVEKVIPAGTGIAEDMRRIGFQPRIVKDKDGGSWIEVSDRMPDNVAGITHATKPITDERGRTRTVIDPTKPVIIQHWPGMPPPRPTPEFDESDFDDFPDMEDEPAPEFDESDFDDLPDMEDEPAPPEFDESDFDDLPDMEDEPAPPEFDESDFDDLPDMEDEPEPPELDEKETPSGTPGGIEELPEFDPDMIRDQLEKMKSKYDGLAAKDDLTGVMKQWMVDQLMDRLKSIPPELHPSKINISQLTDQKIRDLIDNVDRQQLQEDLDWLRKNIDGLDPVLEIFNVKKEQAGEYLDRLERIFSSRTGPAEAEPVRVIAPEGGALPTPTLGEAAIEEMRQGILGQYGAYLTDERARQVANAPVGVYDQDEFNAGFETYHGAGDRYADHTEGFVMRGSDGDPAVVVRSGPDASGTVYHEALHVASNPSFRGLSYGLNESTTEYFTNKLTAPLGIDRGHIAYQSQGGTRLIEELANKVGEDLLAQAYFGEGDAGVEALAQAINRQVQLPEALSEATPFELLLRMTGEKPPQYDSALYMLRGEGAFAPGGQ